MAGQTVVLIGLLAAATVKYTLQEDDGGKRVNVSLSTQGNKTVEIHEGATLTVCVVDFTTTASAEVVIKGETTVSESYNSAIGELDYTPSEVSLSFSPSSNNQTKCEEFSITQDGLDEPAELFQFTFALDTKLQQNIIINVIIFACEKGDIILSKPVREGFTLINYCHNSIDWVMLCDADGMWTKDDAIVICKQAGKYSDNDNVKQFQEQNRISNARESFPKCTGVETHIDDCNKTDQSRSMTDQNGQGEPESTPESVPHCHPVLVDCGTDSSGGPNNAAIAAGVTVPILIIMASACATIIVVFCLWKRGKLTWVSFKISPSISKHLRSQNNNSISSSRPTQNNQQIPNNSTQINTEMEPEYTAPFTLPPFPVSAPVTPSRQPTPRLVNNDHYEGCDMATIVAATKKSKQKPPKQSRKPIGLPYVAPKKSQSLGECPAPSNDDEYSHLQH